MGVSSAHQVVAPRETDPSIAVSAKPAGQYTAKPKMHPMAVIAFVFSLSGLAPLALVLGPIAVAMCSNDPSRRGRGLAIASVIIAAAATAILGLMVVVSLFAKQWMLDYMHLVP